MKKEYKNVTISNEQSYIWFRIAKCGTRSVTNIFRNHTDIDQEGYNFKQFPYDYGKYFKFAIVRNPWPRMLSCYMNKIVEKVHTESRDSIRFTLNIQKPSFKEFLKIVTTEDNISKDLHWATFHDTAPLNELDFIGKLESLQEDFDVICDKIGIPRQELPHKNKSNHKHYTEYYDDEARQIVAEKYAKDIEYFGYKFGE